MSHSPDLQSIKREENKRYHAFFNLAVILSVLTGLEIIAIFLPFLRSTLMTLLVVCSLVKFFAVIFWFMHLIYDSLYLFWIFLTGLLIALGTVWALMYLFDPADLDTSLHLSKVLLFKRSCC
jgi:cytochrome c oxidase subunit 4